VRGVLSAHRGDGDARGWIAHAARASKVVKRIAIKALTRLDGSHGRWARDRRLTPHMSFPRGLPTFGVRRHVEVERRSLFVS
jgi:hypothetical protein